MPDEKRQQAIGFLTHPRRNFTREFIKARAVCLEPKYSFHGRIQTLFCVSLALKTLQFLTNCKVFNGVGQTGYA